MFKILSNKKGDHSVIWDSVNDSVLFQFIDGSCVTYDNYVAMVAQNMGFHVEVPEQYFCQKNVVQDKDCGGKASTTTRKRKGGK